MNKLLKELGDRPQSNCELIISACTGYKPSEIAAFVHSLRIDYTGQIALITDSKSTSIYEKTFFKYGVKIHAAPHKPFKANNHRYYWYNDILDSYPEVERVMLCDSRDVIFQGDPFQAVGKHLFFYAEPIQIKECPINYGWLKTFYGDQIAADLAEKSVICSGTTIGSRHEISEYLKSMVNEMESLPAQFLAREVLDQASHMKLIYSNQFDTFEIKNNGVSEVQTLSHSPYLTFDANGLLLNLNGLPVPVIHQYDRHKMHTPSFNLSVNRNTSNDLSMASRRRF